MFGSKFVVGVPRSGDRARVRRIDVGRPRSATTAAFGPHWHSAPRSVERHPDPSRESPGGWSHDFFDFADARFASNFRMWANNSFSVAQPEK